MRRLLFGLFLCGACAARADQFNQKSVLVGDKGAAMGGAFAGLADDATATYYNPAGLTQLKNVKLNVSAQIVQFENQSIQIAPGTTIPYNSFNFSPSITSFSQRLGQWAYGFSIVTPQNDLFRGEQKLEAAYRDIDTSSGCYDAPGQTPCFTKLSLSYNDVSKINLVGPSLAYKWNDRLSLGITVYGIYYTELEKTSYGGWDGNYVGGDSADVAKFFESLVWRTVNQTGFGLTGSLGVFYRSDATFSMGLKLSPGGFVKVSRLEEQRVEQFLNDSLIKPGGGANTYSTLYSQSQNEHHTEISAPNLSLGAAWTPWAPLTLSGQVDYLLGSLYPYRGYKPVGNDSARSGFELSSAQLREYEVEKTGVVNFSGGIDLRLNPVYSLTVGGFTDFSQGPNDSRESSWNKRIDYFGASLSLGMAKQYTESRFGANVSWGRASISHFQWGYTAGGKPVIATYVDPADNQEKIYRPRMEFDAFKVGVFLSSTLKI